LRYDLSSPTPFRPLPRLYKRPEFTIIFIGEALDVRARIASICSAEARLIRCLFTTSGPPERDQPRRRNNGLATPGSTKSL